MQDDLRARMKKEANIKVGVEDMLQALHQEKARKTKDHLLKLESELSSCDEKLLHLGSQLENQVAQSAYQMAEGWIIGQNIETGRYGCVPTTMCELSTAARG